MANHYTQALFIKSAAKLNQLPPDVGVEVAFVGRSNVGKSSALNYLTGQKHLARISKTPGRTQLINLFSLDENRRLVDLPGYGYANVPLAIKLAWQRHLTNYLESRQCLKGVVILIDPRHPLKQSDQDMIDFALNREILVHILLSKSDKINKSEANQFKNHLLSAYNLMHDWFSVQTFSTLKKEGLPALIHQLDQWYAWEEN